MFSKVHFDNIVNILIVDDKPANLIALESFLSSPDSVVITASSGLEALRLLDKYEFAVILTDVMMPRMDGMEFVSEVKKRENHKDIPIIFMTAMTADVGDIFRAYALGAVDYLQKPLEPEVVKAKVAVFTQLYRQKRLIKVQAGQLLASERREQEYRLAEIEDRALQERQQSALIKHKLEVRVAQQLALAEFSRLTLLETNVDALMQEAVAVVQRILAVDRTCILTLNSNQTNTIMKAGSGWPPISYTGPEIDRQTVQWFRSVLDTTEPVIINRTDSELQCPHHKDQGIVASATVVVHGTNEPFGLLSVFSLAPREFSPDETSFLQAMGGVLGIACERYKSETTVRELTRSNSELEQFSFAASHDLQEPLRKMISFAQLLEQEYSSKLDINGLAYLDFIVDGAKRMKVLIDDLLELSRVGTGKISDKPIALESALAAALSNLEVQILETGATFKIDSLPTLQVDPSSMLRLFQNLVSNALKYRSNDVPQITITCEKQARHWKFCVRDNGIGIDQSYLEKIFVVFQRLHGKNKYPGTGIGLAICKKVVDQHGGRIWAESSPGEGSSFYFTLPHTQVRRAA